MGDKQLKKAPITEAVQGMTYPATKDDVIHYAEERGVGEIQWGQNQTLNLRVVFNRYPDEVFLSRADIENAVARVVEQESK